MRSLLFGLLLLFPAAVAVAQEMPPIPLPRPERLSEPVASPPEAEVPDESASPDAAEAAAPDDAKEAAPDAAEAAAPDDAPATTADAAPTKTPPPVARVYQTACPAVMAGQVEATILPPITTRNCSVRSPLSLTGVVVNGRMTPLSSGVVTDCAMATALPQWISQVDGYLWAHENTRIAEVHVGTSYMCRNRVGGSSTDKQSEHAFADAFDVTGFTLGDGRTINVESGWNGGDEAGQSALHFAHDAACSIFATTLGPDANAEHHDHLHVDFGCHGKTCTARLCE